MDLLSSLLLVTILSTYGWRSMLEKPGSNTKLRCVFIFMDHMTNFIVYVDLGHLITDLVSGVARAGRASAPGAGGYRGRLNGGPNINKYITA